MKLMSSLLFLCSLSAFATPVQTVKLLTDGTTVRCRNKHDMIRSQREVGAYRARAYALRLKEERVDFKINLKFLQCQMIDKDRYGFVYQSPYKKTSFSLEGYPDMSEIIQVDVEPVQVVLKGYEEQAGTLLINHRIKNSAIQNASVQIDRKNLLTEEDEQRLIEGQIVVKRVMLWLAKDLIRSNSKGVKMQGRENYGVFNVMMNFYTEDGVVKTRFVK